MQQVVRRFPRGLVLPVGPLTYRRIGKRLYWSVNRRLLGLNAYLGVIHRNGGVG